MDATELMNYTNALRQIKDQKIEIEKLKKEIQTDLCNDSKTFAELVAKLLNEYYNRK